MLNNVEDWVIWALFACWYVSGIFAGFALGKLARKGRP